MKLENLRKKQIEFLIHKSHVDDEVSKIRILLDKFHKDFKIEDINTLALEDFASGRLGMGKETFCYWMEYKLDKFGAIGGSPLNQFGVWFAGRKEYKHTKRYGINLENAYKNILSQIQAVYFSGKEEDYDGIAQNMIADKFKGKILAVYFPDKYLSLYGAEYLNKALKYFNLDDHIAFEQAPIYKQLRLLEWKDKDAIMSLWDLPTFAFFLNHELHNFFPDEKDREGKDQENIFPNFPPIFKVKPEIIDGIIDEGYIPKEKKDIKDHNRPKPDYNKKSFRDIAVGTRGEQIVFEYEKRKLQDKSNKYKQVKWVSKDTDGKGFDIRSYELDGTEMQIEVKSTVKKFKGNLNFFLTEFERAISIGLSNYYVYYITDILSENPVIYKVKAPFKEKDKGVQLAPIAYQVKIKLKQ